jgi:hypothetical protein
MMKFKEHLTVHPFKGEFNQNGEGREPVLLNVDSPTPILAGFREVQERLTRV